LIALYCIALAARLVPLTFSPLPYNIDGFPLARISQQIATTGTWRIDEATVNSYDEKMPAFSLLWAAVSMLAGWHPLAHAELYIALIASLVVLPAYLIAVKASGRRLVGFGAGLFVSLFGSFLFLTSVVTKESLGLLVLPVVVLLFAGRADRKKRALAVVFLVLLPFLHSLTVLLALGMVASLVVLTHRRAWTRGRFSAKALAVDAVTGPALAGLALLYYEVVKLPFLTDLIAPAALVLFLALVVLLTAALMPLARPAHVRLGRPLGTPATRLVLPPAVSAALLVVNAQTSLFAGAGGTRPALLWMLPGIVALVVLAVVGYGLVRRTSNRANDLVVSMLVSPVALILFGLFRGLDPVSLIVVYRSFDFIDYALALLAALGFVAAWRALRSRPLAKVGLAGTFLAALLATTPMAWNTPAVFGVENVTTSDEFHALAVLASLGARNVTTDQRLADVGATWFGYTTDKSLPMTLRDRENVTGFDYAVVLERWTTVGAQIHPAPNIVLEPSVIDAFLRANRIAYVAGPLGDRIFVVQILG